MFNILISYLKKVNVLNKAMGKKLKKIFSVTLILALSINFVLYSSQSYSPPKAESISYSIVNCPTHDGGHHATIIINFFVGSEGENGAEKDCFCYDCCGQRLPSFITAQTVNLTLARYSYYRFQSYDFSYTEDSYKNLPIRSPPDLILI